MQTTKNNFKYKDREKPQSAGLYGKVPPNNQQVEKDILGAILLDKRAFEVAADILHEDVFYVEAHRLIFKNMQSLAAKNQPIDLNTVAEQLIKSGNLESCGGVYYLTTLTNSVVSSANIDAHSRIILEKYIKRELIRASLSTLNNAYDDTTDVFDVLDEAEETFSSLQSSNIQNSYKDIQTVAVKSIERIIELRNKNEDVTGVHTGFPDLDHVTCGWQEPDLIILAARPSVGKTAFALTLAKNAAKSIKKTAVGIFSLEMKDRQLVDRVLSQETNIWMWKLKKGNLTDNELDTLYSGANRLGDTKILIDDTAALSIQEFRTKARAMKRKENVGLIIIDYLQLMTVRGKGMQREQEIAKISSEIKSAAKELSIPIIALSQLSRDLEKTGSAKIGRRDPQLSDLRESGAIEQDADVVMFLFKPSESEVGENASLKDNFYLKIAKHRNGDLARFIGKFTGENQTHHYINVLSNETGMPIGSKWVPVSKLPHNKPIDYSLPKSEQYPDEDMPF